MRSIRVRLLISGLVLVVAGLGGWQLLPADRDNKPITVGTTDVVTSLDPAGAYDAGSWALFSNIYQSLLTFKPGSVTPVPDAASSCGFAGSELTTYRCTLRDDLRFPNGHIMTTDDVKYSFDRVLAIKSDAGPRSLFATLKSVVAEGKKVTFHLTSADATFPLKIATGAGSIVDHTQYPASELLDGDAVVGTGPYLLKSYRPGATARLEPNPDYRGVIRETGAPVNIRYFKMPAQLAAAWKSRSIDVTHRQLPPSLIAELGKGGAGGDVQVTETASAATRNLVFNTRAGSPMADKTIRKAIAAVIDRPKLASGVYDSTVDPLFSLIPQGITAHSTPFFDDHPEPDTAGARKLIEGDAGVRTPITFTLAYAEGGAARPEAAELRRQLESTGLFKVKLLEKEWTEFQQGYSSGQFDAYTISWLPDFPDPDSFIQPLIGRDSSLRNGYVNDKADELIRSTQRYTERSRASGDFRSLQELAAQDAPVVPLWQKKDYVVSTQNVSGSQYLSDGTGLWRLWQLGWI
jgi:peptide/nickel transport system substrate-binding protein